MMAVDITSEPFAVGGPRALFETGPEFAANDYMTTYDVAPDGRFLMIKQGSEERSEQPHFIVVENWFDELERLLPTEN